MSLMIMSAAAMMAMAAAPDKDLCAVASQVTQGRACVQSRDGIAISDDATRARQLLGYADAGATRFRTRFNREPLPFAVVETNDGKVAGATLAGLKAAGFGAVLPWLSAAGFQTQIEASVRRAVEAQTAGLSSEAREAVVQQALAQVASKPVPAGRDAGAVPHELGHIWYAEAYWPGQVREGGHYGAPGPDWMDETAAVLMETAEFAADRTKQFGELYNKLRKDRALDKAPDNELVDLPRFFALSHPGVARGKAMVNEIKKGLGDTPQDGIVIRASTGPEAEKFAAVAAQYYLQATLVAEYLIARTGDSAVFARIGAAFGRGETMGQWLANLEPKGQLPRSIAALQADWLRWLDQRFPLEGSKPAA